MEGDASLLKQPKGKLVGKVTQEEKEFLRLNEQIMYKRLLSIGSSCKLSDIQGIIYGPFTTRFWLYRKHVNSLAMTDIV